MKQTKLYSLAAFFLLSACSIHTDIQSRYLGERDTCREVATLKQQAFGSNNAQSSSANRDAQLLTLFSECMFERGWTVASPNVGLPTPPIDPNDTVRSRGAPAASGRVRPVQNPVSNTPLSLDENAPISTQEPTPMQSGIPGGSSQSQFVPNGGDVSISRSGVPVYEPPRGGAAFKDPTRTMEEDFLRANRRR